MNPEIECNHKNKTKTLEEALSQEYCVKLNNSGAGYPFGVVRFPKCLIGCKIKIMVIEENPSSVTITIGQHI